MSMMLGVKVLSDCTESMEGNPMDVRVTVLKIYHCMLTVAFPSSPFGLCQQTSGLDWRKIQRSIMEVEA